MIVLDTDLLTIFQPADSPLYERLTDRLDASGQEVVTTIVSFEEQMRGWLSIANKARTPEDYIDVAGRFRRFLENYQRIRTIDFDTVAANRLRQIKAAKVRISTMDLRIAAIVLAHDATLITRNLRDFRKVPGLRAEDWPAA